MDQMVVKVVIVIVMRVPHWLQIVRRVKLGIIYKALIVIHVVVYVQHVKVNKVNIGMAVIANPA